MQVFLSAVTRVLLPAIVMSANVVKEPPDLRTGIDVTSWRIGVDSHSACPTAPPPQNWILDQVSRALLSSTTIAEPAIKEPRPSPAFCGLGGCATTHTSNPLLFIMQVCEPDCFYTKRTGNHFLVQLPSPQCCFDIACECLSVIRSILLQSGDIETNPGPDTDAVLAELKKLSAGQTTIIADMQGLKSQCTATSAALANLSKRLADLEGHYQKLLPMQIEIQTIRADTEQTARLVHALNARVDDAENRSRRNNLVFYGLPDTAASETSAASEEKILRLCSDHLNVPLEPQDIERAHRVSRYSANRPRPLIVRFNHYKKKEMVLSNGRKLKGTDLSMGEDFSPAVRNARKQLVSFAKAKSVPFSLRFKTLLIGSKRYVFDDASQTVKEI
ncbi:uncharacterized protein LOC125940304 [Dermacentor silvarum]|uniref:uncharacterized protein LOC125940304 n=1 Tax=Dermacentor silvarum TaxID=543639 RepID=UPI002100A68D|nr:uncharacterized protein LOC125940304 [Dermacentor silvarum]